MYYLGKATTLFNRYIIGYRYDFIIKDYFEKDKDKKAVMTLYKEGYPVKNEYKRLINEYKSNYSTLNYYEEKFIQNNLNEYLSNKDSFITKEEIEKEEQIFSTMFSLLFSDLNSQFKMFELDTLMKVYMAKSDILSKEIKRIIPTYKAVLIKKFSKILQERIINKFPNILMSKIIGLALKF